MLEPFICLWPYQSKNVAHFKRDHTVIGSILLPRLGLYPWYISFNNVSLLSVQDEPLSIDCGGGPASTTPSSLLSTTSPLSSWMNDNNGTEETEFGSTLDVDAIKVKHFFCFDHSFSIFKAYLLGCLNWGISSLPYLLRAEVKLKIWRTRTNESVL